MIWLFIIVPVVILLGIVIFMDKKNKGVGNAPDVNKGNHGIETETTRFQHYNDNNGGN
ncbi:hypothetical protein JOC95_001826 [Bacillus tianshenii]|uniref:Uncharacterized protein n=1 Tax=Sutcliffiella tianshenii TaxID=1463404 RepID=A0ABS2NZC9_9BACI|nr:hypothetical protein [Bacillus tianshenii]MBM7619974.1 hypothetical protein [Bacillus tianshenii]